MAKLGKLPIKQYSIYHFDMFKLFEYGNIIDGYLVCDEENTKKAYYLIKENAKSPGVDKKGDCQLFNQTIKALTGVKEYKGEIKEKEKYFEDIFINVDYKSYMNIYSNSEVFERKLLNIPNGIKLWINGKEHIFVDFLKSNSMSKACCIYYVNKDYEKYILPRMTFGFDENDVVLSKWYAYSGLSISDALVLEDIKFNNGELVVIPDKERNLEVDCITAISIDYLYKVVDEYIEAIDGIKGKLDLNEFTTIEEVNNCISSISDKSIVKIIKKNIKKLELKKKEIDCYENSEDVNIINTKLDEEINSLVHLLTEITNKDNSLIFQKRQLALNVKDKYADYMNPEINQHEVYWKKMSVKSFPTNINKFDGEGFISKEFGEELHRTLKSLTSGDYKNKFGFTYQIRLPFTKGIVNVCDFKSFFREKRIDHIYGMTFSNDKSKEYKKYDINNVKIILTESQFKCSGFIRKIKTVDGEEPIDAYMRLLNEYDYRFAINNLEPSHKKLIDLNYQFFSTMPLNQSVIKKIKIHNEQIYKISTECNTIVKSIFDREENKIDALIYDKYPKFYLSTKRFQELKRPSEELLKKNYLKLHFKVPGYRKFLCGDLLELLYHCAYHQKGNIDTKEHLRKNSFYAPNTMFKDGEKCILLRNPHYSRNEIGVLKNSFETGTEREKYFGHLTGVIMYNPLTQLADRLGGADYDGDTIVILSEKYFNRTISNLFINRDNKNKLKYPIIKIPGLSKGSKVQINYKNKVKCLYNTFNSRVGLISNNAFKEALTLYNEEFEKHDKIAFYTIINGLEIDSAKQGIKPQMTKGQENKIAKKYLDLKKEIENKKYIDRKLVKKILSINNDHIIFELMKSSINFKPAEFKREKKNINVNINSIDLDNVLSMVEIVSCYNLILRIINHYKKRIKTDVLKSEEKLFNKIKEILLEKGVTDYLTFIKECIYNIDYPVEKIKIYCDNQFHYLTKFEDKKSFIEDELNLYFTDEQLRIICDFTNEGYMLLYLLLYYVLNQQKSVEYKPIDLLKDNLISKEVNKQIDKLLKVNYNQDINKDNMGYKVKKLCLDILKTFDDYDYNDLESLKSMKKQLCETLKEKSTNIKLDEFLLFNDLYDNNIVFDVLYNQLLDYLKVNEGK